jgi:hypothetical protein
MNRRGGRTVLALMSVLALAGCATGPGAGSGGPDNSLGARLPTDSPRPSMTLGEIRGEIYSRYTDQLLGIGDGAGYVAVDLKATATAAAAEIVGRYGSAVRVVVGFFPYPPPPSPSGACDWAPKPSVDPGSLRAVIELPSTTITHSVGLRGKVRITNTGSKTITFDTGQPLSIYLFTPTGAAPIGASSGAVAGTGSD